MANDEAILKAKEDMSAHIKKIWDDIRINLPQDALDKDEVWFWWPTITSTFPNWEALIDNMLAYNLNPVVTMLTVFYYGFAAGLEYVLEEGGPLVNMDNIGQNRLPAWLQDEMMERLAEVYKDRH